MNKKERIILAIGEVNEKYIKEAESSMRRTPILVAAACFALVIALSLYLFIPFAPVTSDLGAYESSAYYPLIEKVEDYRLTFKQPAYKNNFQAITSGIAGFLGMFNKAGSAAPDMNGSAGAPEMDGSNGAPEMGGNGNYVESTDNQVEGVIESDLMKMTDRYIFRIGFRSDANQRTSMLRVYSIEKENSQLVAEFEIPSLPDERHNGFDYQMLAMYLSADCNTVTLTKNYLDTKGDGNIGVISLDVSDVTNISVKSTVSIDGSLKTSRMTKGKLLLVTEYVFNRYTVDYNNPATFVPTIDSGDGAKPVVFEDIIFPEEVGNTRYSVVALLDSENLELLGANALLNFTNDVYISENNVFITREYTQKIPDGNNQNLYISKTMSDIAVLNYSGERLEKKGVITMEGQAEDQYSFDEKDGYLRVVATTFERTVSEGANTTSVGGGKRNVSLYIYSLTDNSLAYTVMDFAIEGEEATAVRFDGDKVYVCTAVVVNFTDPVYFFDLSDYENITFSDTGVIEGYSDHLINLGEGFTLGIGRENWQYSKVEIYEQQGEQVVSVAEFKFQGEYSTDYKSYMVNRELNLFGFAVDHYANELGNDNYKFAYILLQFDGYNLTPVVIDLYDIGLQTSTVRAAFIDGYLYITTPIGFSVNKIY